MLFRVGTGKSRRRRRAGPPVASRVARYERSYAGTAVAGEDYQATAGTPTFAPGETTQTITIEVKGDGKRQVTEYFHLDLYGFSSNGLFAKNRGLGAILNDV